MLTFYLSIPLILLAFGNVKAINYASYRHNDTVSIDVSSNTPRTTREILEKLNMVLVQSPQSLQDGTEHLLQFAALLRTKILDTFGLLIYDYYDDFDMSEMHSLYRIYQDTLERKYNIFEIIPNVLLNQDLKPKAICNYINYHVSTCLGQVAHTCTKSKFPEIEQDQDNLTISLEIAKSVYDSARLEEKYKNGISLPAILDFLKINRLKFTPQMFSGLLHNIHYDDFDDTVRTAERELIHYFLTTGRHVFQKYLLKPQSIKQYSSVTKLLKGFLQSHPFPLGIKRHAEYLGQHIIREPSAISENIELLGAAYEDDSINLRYLFELVIPDDAHDSDIIEARDYLLDQMLRQNVLENYLKVEKYQQLLPNQMLMGILGQLRDIDFITDIATSLQIHAKFWHSSHMIENLNQLIELFDAYENLRDIPEHKKLMSTIDKLRSRLINSNNATIEMSCTRPRNCLRIGLNVIVQCNGINKETKKLINRFLNKSNFDCPNQKLMGKSDKPEDHETVSNKPIINTTRKNSQALMNINKLKTNLTTESSILPTKLQTKPYCSDDELCEEDDTLATGNTKITDANVTAELNISAQAIKKETPEMIVLSTVLPNIEVSTEPQADDLVLDKIPNPVEVPTAECNNLTCAKNKSEVEEIITTAVSDLDKIFTEAPTRSTKSSIGTSTIATRVPVFRISATPEMIATTSEPIVTISKPTCQHRDLHYRQKLRRLEKIDKSNAKIHHNDFKNLKQNDVNKNTISVSATNSVVELNASGTGGQTQAKNLTKIDMKYEPDSNTENGQSSEKLLDSLGDNLKTSGHIATIDVKSGSSRGLKNNKKRLNKKTLELIKKLQALADIKANLASDSSQENQSKLHPESSQSNTKIDSHEKLKNKLRSDANLSGSVEDEEKQNAEYVLSHLDVDRLHKLLKSNGALELEKKLLGGNDLLSIEDNSELAKLKSRNKALSLLSQLKNHKTGSHHTHVMEAAESQRKLSGHQETLESTTGGGLIGSHHSRRNLGKTEEASTTEHRHKITQQYRESSRRNSKKSRNTTKGKLITTSEDPVLESRMINKYHFGPLSKSRGFQRHDEITVKYNDSVLNDHLFDWNAPLISKYDIALNETEPEKVYYRPKREPQNQNKNKNYNANINKNDETDIESRMFDINLPFFSNYDVALSEKFPFSKSRSGRDIEAVKKDLPKGDSSVKKDLNSSDQDIKTSLINLNVAVESNQKRRVNAPDSVSTQPPSPQSTTHKKFYRSGRDTTKKNETQADPKATTADPNITKSTSNNSATDLKPRFLDIQASFGLDGLHAAVSNTDKNKSNSTSKNTTEETKGSIDLSLPSLTFEKPKSRKRREAQNYYEGDNFAPSGVENRRNVDTLFSAVGDLQPDEESIKPRLFDFNLPMGSNQKWRFFAPEESEKKYRSRRFADVTATPNTATVTNLPLSTDKNVSNSHNNTNNTTVISSTIAPIEVRMGNDNITITDSNTTEKINITTVSKQ